MRILYSVQRYGQDIVGGSEAACRHFAEQLVQRGHQVEVITSCAKSYIDWADEYPPGDDWINGVHVHRFAVSEKRTEDRFGKIHPWMCRHPESGSLGDQIRWARLMGPQLKAHQSWLMRHAHNFDVVVFMTYLYSTTTSGLPLVSGRVPTILQPTAHDEPAAYVSLFKSIFRQADALLFFTPEERSIVEKLYLLKPTGNVIGIGLEQEISLEDHGFRDQFDLDDSPYLVYVGRIDESKGVGELVRFFSAYKKRNPSELKLVLAGDPVMPIEDNSDVVVTGFLSTELKAEAIRESIALVQPSYFESFSIVLCESWLNSRPALVQGRCEVLDGQARRSGGAIPYQGFAEFEFATNFLLKNPEIADAMGRSGREYVAEQYNWNTVLDRFESTVELAKTRFAERSVKTKQSR